MKNQADSSIEDDNTGNSLELQVDASHEDTGLCDILGCGGDRQPRADMVVSACAITNDNHRAPPTDIFLNQSDPGVIGRRRFGRNAAKKSKRKSSTSSSADVHHEESDLTSLIASELTKLSIEDRQKALEEVHGVVDNEEEDPEEINKLFDQIKEELKRIRYKQAYEKAAFLSESYVNNPEFLLSFLRADNYKPRPAASRLVEHFKYKLELFGEDTLIRDIMYDDMSEDEKAVLSSGFIQALPAADQSGRQIVVCNMSEFLKVGNLTNVLRATWYLGIRNVQMHGAMSKRGIVGVYLAHGMGNILDKLYGNENINGFTQKAVHAIPFRHASVHFCFENYNPLGSAIQTYVMMTLGKYSRIRFRSHCGSRLECRYSLKGFGIDIGSFETSSLVDSMQEVLRRCRELDETQQRQLNARILPQPNDVLLGRGRPFQLYSGNLALTAMIDRNRIRYTQAKKRDKKAITTEIVHSIKDSGGRFLKKNNSNGNEWREVDFETARLKVSHSFRTMSKLHSDDDAYQSSKASGEMSDASVPSTISNADSDFTHSSKRRKGENSLPTVTSI